MSGKEIPQENFGLGKRLFCPWDPARIQDPDKSGRYRSKREEKMAIFVCKECGNAKEGRCKPRKCPECGAVDSFEKKQ